MDIPSRILRSWDRTRKVFSAGNNSKGINGWIDIVRILAAGQAGMPLQQFRGRRNSGKVRRQLNRWEAAGIVILWHHIGDHATNGRRRLRVRATPKAAQLLKL